MSEVLFDDKSQKPDPAALADALGAAGALWDELRRRLDAKVGPLGEDWIFGGKKYGWSLRLKQKKRPVLTMSPRAGYFRVGVALGEDAVEAAQHSGLPAALVESINLSPRYPEGKAARLEIHSKKDVDIAEKLAALRMAN